MYPKEQIAQLTARVALLETALGLGDGAPATHDELAARMAAVQEDAAARHGISRGDLLGRSRRAEYVAARHLAMWVCRHALGASSVRIARAFNRDHTSVNFALRSLRDALDTEPVVRSMAKEMEQFHQPKTPPPRHD